jgi:hypothetical protein
VERSQVFEQRRRIYSQLDAQLYSRTRFFAAAALTNAVLAQLFRFLPRRSLSSVYRLLNEGGAVLEAANVQFAHDLPRRSGSDRELDRFLVCSEQRRLQTFLDARVDNADCHWLSIRGELNRLLNGQHCASPGSRWLAQSREYGGILHNVRTRLGMPLDFAAESHRVHIGCGLIGHIRQGDTGANNLTAFAASA